MDEETVSVEELLETDVAPTQPRRRPGRPRKVPLPEDVTIPVDVADGTEPKRRRRRSTKLSTAQVAEGIALASGMAAEARGTPFWAYSKEEAEQWCFPLTDLLNRLPDRWIKHSTLGIGLTFAAMAFWKQTKPRLEMERHFQAQRREREHSANGPSHTTELSGVWGEPTREAS
jgi:hypothetical protein